MKVRVKKSMNITMQLRNCPGAYAFKYFSESLKANSQKY